jgi:diguanylate cyclase (GGDEF)-like protein
MKILIVDNSPLSIKLAGEILREKYDISIATNSIKAIERAKIEQPDLILLSVEMNDIDGYTVCAILKDNDLTKDIPVIFVNSSNNVEDVIKGFSVGGVDYILKPFNPIEVSFRIKNHLELKKSKEEVRKYASQMEKLNELLKRKNDKLLKLNRQLAKNAKTDILTNIMNRRGMLEVLKQEEQRKKRNNKKFSVIICDIDHFKIINDTYGHECGDKVLKKISKLFVSSIRKSDSVCRWGGEEFLFLLPETLEEGALCLAENIRKKINKMQMSYKGEKILVTMTFGIAEYDETSIDSTVKKDDDALYNGKNSGRNRSINYSSIYENNEKQG